MQNAQQQTRTCTTASFKSIRLRAKQRCETLPVDFELQAIMHVLLMFMYNYLPHTTSAAVCMPYRELVLYYVRSFVLYVIDSGFCSN